MPLPYDMIQNQRCKGFPTLSPAIYLVVMISWKRTHISYYIPHLNLQLVESVDEDYPDQTTTSSTWTEANRGVIRGVIRGGSKIQELPKFLPSSYMAPTNPWPRTRAPYNNKKNFDQLVESVDENHPIHPKPSVLNKDRLGSEVGGREGGTVLLGSFRGPCQPMPNWWWAWACGQIGGTYQKCNDG